MFAAKFITRTIVAATAALSLAACSDNPLVPEVEQDAAPAAEQTPAGAGQISPDGLTPSLTLVSGNSCEFMHFKGHLARASYGEACLMVNQKTSTSFTYTPAAADLARDGDSVLHESWVSQYVNGAWSRPISHRFYNSGGAGTTKRLDQRTMYKTTGATKLRTVVRVCRYDTPTGSVIACSAKVTTIENWY